ncbi:sugar ABC transporter ATP-binding protein [Acidisoma cellulosilytica]|uniref:Sugar ABC transporter ATP-binding protein n=1 Tax=Acidisoma cellulosilyticum TaxID=2802395 RepID=A0A963Z6P8_9PROT|nr:sugar ABC transporter ATP-binding protein [Acidisoma cellulosilyticum]MCB8883566.1 sugar ABC transporter ATP-binding protein [Acidisoma cellulosilyticum]
MVSSVLSSAPRATDGAAAAFALKTEKVSRSFGPTRVLHDVSFSVPVGDSRALVGRNGAGKSTLVAIVTGMLSPSAGVVELAGLPAPALGDRAAWRERVACVYQRWTVIPTLTVAENLYLNSQPRNRLGLIGWNRLREQARATLAEWGLDVEPDLMASRLTVEQRQIVEIGRALLQGSRLLILDEPTAELERREVHRLFDRIRHLQQSGVTFIYISHHLEEIYEICRSVTVLRDGLLVADAPLGDMPKGALVQAMVGAAAGAARAAPVGRETVGPAALTVKDLAIGTLVQDVSFNLQPGECMGLAGLAGSGKEEIGEAIIGLRRYKGLIQTAQPGDRIGYVPRDRHERGILPQLSIAENLTVTVTDSFGRFGFISPRRQNDRASALVRSLGIVSASLKQPISELSGGNQQKGLMGRALASAPKVLVLVSPTQGVDIASKEALFGIVAKAQAEGAAVLIISDDLDELAVCDRVQVIFRGRLTRQFGRDRNDEDIVAAIEGLEEEQHG